MQISEPHQSRRALGRKLAISFGSIALQLLSSYSCQDFVLNGPAELGKAFSNLVKFGHAWSPTNSTLPNPDRCKQQKNWLTHIAGSQDERCGCDGSILEPIMTSSTKLIYKQRSKKAYKSGI